MPVTTRSTPGRSPTPPPRKPSSPLSSPSPRAWGPSSTGWRRSRSFEGSAGDGLTALRGAPAGSAALTVPRGLPAGEEGLRALLDMPGQFVDSSVDVAGQCGVEDPLVFPGEVPSLGLWKGVGPHPVQLGRIAQAVGDADQPPVRARGQEGLMGTGVGLPPPVGAAAAG